MERRKRYLKFAALVPAIVLAGGFVGVQAGVLPPLPIPGFSKPAPQPDPQPEPAAANQSPVPPQEPTLIEVVSEGDPTFMGGSKTIIFAKPPGTPPAGTQPDWSLAPSPPPGATPPVFLGGSKSAPIITPPPAPPKP